jgi:Ca2+-binding RTX toxin-like protein
VPFEDGVGACVFAFNSTSPFRGALRYIDYDDRECTWYVYGLSGADYLYTPDRHDGGETVCTWVDGQVGGLKSEVVLPPSYDDCLDVHGDAGSISSGDGDHIWSYNAGQIYGDGGNDYIYGSDYADTLEGDYGGDVIYGYGGGDTVQGWEHDDDLYGGDGNDDIQGYTGYDLLVGQAGGDTLTGGDDADILYGDNYGGGGGNLGYDSCGGGGGTDTCNSAASPYYCDLRSSCELP